jgi:DNA-binding transcriptional LysR family regulator
MNLDHLRYFVAAAETLHTAKAANILNVSQSTISHGITKIEEDLGLDLFEKVGRRIVLSEQGQSFLKEAQTLLAYTQELKDKFRSPHQKLEGLIRFGASHGLSSLLATPAVAEIQKVHPDLQFEIYSLRSAQVAEGIVKKSLDLGFCFSPTSHPEIEELGRRSTPLKIAVKKGHPILDASSSDRIDLLNELPCASAKAFSGIEVCEKHPALAKKNIESQTQMIFDSYEVASMYLKKSKAWCLLPEYFVEVFNLAVVELPNFNPPAYISLIKPRGRLFSAAIEKVFISVL